MLTEELAGPALLGLGRVLDTASRTDIDAESGVAITVPDAQLMFQGEYRKAGFDLVITDQVKTFVIHDYFRVDRRPELRSPEGASLNPDVIAGMAISEDGLRVAQAGAPPAPSAIGRVETVTGTATAIRNGTPVALNQGDPVYRGDVVQTDRGSSLGITFIDGSVFNLSANARMALNDMVYSPAGGQSSALLNIVQGSVSFLAGQVAKTGTMQVGTPVATMGIRGTLVTAEVDANNGTTRFSVVREQNGETGRFDLIRDGRVIATISAAGQVTTVTPTGQVTTQPQTLAEQQAEQLVVAQVYQIFSLGQANPIIPGLPGTTPASGPGGQGGGGGGSSSPDGNGATTPAPLPATPPLASQSVPVNPNQLVISYASLTQDVPAQTTAGSVATPADLPEQVVFVRAGSSADPAGNVAVAGTNPTTIAGTYGTLAIAANGTYAYLPLRAAPLAQGATGQDTFIYELRDPDTGVTREVTLTFTITGQNDAPIVGPALAGATVEDSGPAAFDLLASSSDVDQGATLHVENVVWTGRPGSLPPGFALSPDGNAILVDSNSAAINRLAQGETFQATFTFDVVDEFGARTQQSLTLSVAGRNDAPMASAAASGGASEGDGVLGFGLANQVTDVDDGAVLHIENLVWTGGPGLPAGFALGADGLSLSVDPGASAYDGLGQGETRSFTFAYQVVDEFGARTDQTATFVIAGTNDAPTVSQALSASAPEGGSAGALDLLAASADVDGGSSRHVEGFAWADSPGALPAGFALAGDGTTLTFDPADPAYNSLGEGQTFTARFSYDVVDEFGARTAQTATVTIAGTNDAPTVTGPATASAGEGDASFTFGLAAQAQDPDSGTILHIENLVRTDGGGGGLPPGFTLAAGGLSFQVDPADPAYDSLAQGETRTFTFAYDIVDEGGARVGQNATVTIAGTNDTPVAGPVAAAVPEGASGSVNLLATASDPDAGSTLHVENVVWTDNPGGFPAGFVLSPDGNSILVDASGGAYESLAVGQSFAANFSFDVVDELGGRTAQNATIIVQGTNDAPTAFDDAAAATAGGTVSAVTRTGGLLGNDADVDQGEAERLTVSGVHPGNDPATPFTDVPGTGAVVAGTYGTLTINPDGTYTYLANNAGPLGPGELGSDIFTYRIVDANGAAGTASLTVEVTGVNDTPVLSGAAVGTVREDVSFTAFATLNAADPDPGATQTWQVQGGTAAHPADYLFALDTLRITGDSGTIQYENRFDGTTPTGSTRLPATLGYTTALPQSGGRLLLQDENAEDTIAIGGTDPFVLTNTILQSSTAATGTNGLRRANTFNVEAMFDLTSPDDLREAYGLRLTDVRTGGGGDDIVELVFRRGADGFTRVQFRQLDTIADTITTLGTIFFTPAGGEDQIQLRLIHAAGSDLVTAALDVLDNGVVTRTLTVGGTGILFGADTPGTTADDETWTRAQVVAFAPSTADSFLNGTYGILSVNQAGRWEYDLLNGNQNVQALAQGETVQDVFQIVATDNGGAQSAPYTITVDVQGTNDAPTVSGPFAGAATEGPGSASFDLASNASDRDNFATLHVENVQAVSPSGSYTTYGFTLAPDGRTLLLDTGSNGLDYLAAGESGVFTFSYDVVDEFGARIAQTANITVTGTNDAPTVTAAAPATIVEINDSDATPGLSETTVALTVSDPDDVPTYDLTGWSSTADPGVYQLSGLYGTAFLDTVNNTLRYVFDEAGAGPNLNDGQVAYDTIGVTVTDGAASSTASVTFSVNGRTDGFDGSFETGFVGWDTLANAEAIQMSGAPDGASVARVLTSSTTPYQDVASFLGVPSGALAENPSTTNTSDDATVGSAFRSIGIHLDAGQQFTFKYFFSTDDYAPFNDFGFFTVDETDQVFELADTESVGNYGSSGWQAFSYTAATSGDFHFGFGVLDTGDGIVSSTLSIDDVQFGNTPPSVSGPVSGSAAEDSGTASFDLTGTASDPDSGAVLHVANLQLTSPPADYANYGFGLSSDGHTLTFDTTNSGLSYLAAGDSATFAFTYDVVDEHDASTPQTASVQVTGANDAPSTTGAITDTIQEGGSGSMSLLSTASDPDQGAVLHVENVVWTDNGSGTLPAGFSLSPDGNNIVVDASDPAYDSLAEGDAFETHFSFEVVDQFGARTSESATVTILGTDDTPTGSSPPSIVDDDVLTNLSGSFEIPTSALLYNDAPAYSGDLTVISVPSGPAALSGNMVGVTGSGPGSFMYEAQESGTDQSGTANVAFQGAAGQVILAADSSGSILIASESETALQGNSGIDVFVLQAPSLSGTYSAHDLFDVTSAEDAVDISKLVNSGQFATSEDSVYLLSNESGNYDLCLETDGGEMLNVAHLQAADATAGPLTVIWDHHIVWVYAAGLG